MTSHPLDRPVWSALTTRHACWAEGDSLALRIHRDVGLFVAALDRTPAAADAAAALVDVGETVGMLEIPGWPIPAGLRATVVPLVQMV
ncbi:MAG TPA: GNAT family N-acetyltransferase, partial [Sphingomonas sp.]|nr:GNAT family N-acetyltransferase [Sphingomonas sp.]